MGPKAPCLEKASPIINVGMDAGMGGADVAMNPPAGGVPANPVSQFAEYGGIDPSLDPELAMAIRVSTEEARAQEEARVKAAQDQVCYYYSFVVVVVVIIIIVVLFLLLFV